MTSDSQKGDMVESTTSTRWGIPHGSVLQLPADHALRYVESALETSKSCRILHDEFEKEGYAFYLERAKVFVFADGPRRERRQACLGSSRASCRQLPPTRRTMRSGSASTAAALPSP